MVDPDPDPDPAAEDDDATDSADGGRAPTFQANKCNRGACAKSIFSPNRLTNAAPELASREVEWMWSGSTGLRLLVSSVVVVAKSLELVVEVAVAGG